MTYSSKLRAVLAERGQPGFGTKRMNPPEWVLELQYQKKLLGGFNKRNRCLQCNVCLPSTGQCDYC